MIMANEEYDDKHQHQQQLQSSYHRTTLPTDIIVEVLLKLPVESLLRCKAVCMSWCSLISEPHFIKAHLNLSAHRRLIFGVWTSLLTLPNILNICFLDDVMNHSLISNALEVDYPLKSATTKSVRVVGSCNGLLLLCLRLFSTNDPLDGILSIWNPSTRKYHKLPSDGYTTYDPLKLFGFGYDDSNDDYKVVSVSCNLNMGRFESFGKMYSLRNGSWKDIGVFPHGFVYGCNKLLNGSLHWLASEYDDDHSKIVSLDLATETFGEVLQPVYDEGRKELILGTLGEWLCVLCDYCKVRVDIWVMKVYGVKGSWTKLISVPYMPESYSCSLSPLCIANDGRILFKFGKKLMISDSKNNSFSVIQNFDERVHFSTFVETLVSPLPPGAALGHKFKGGRTAKLDARIPESLGRTATKIQQLQGGSFAAK